MHLAFHNGDPKQSKIVSILDMASLLEEVIVEPTVGWDIAATVVDTLQNIVDFAGQKQSLQVPDSNDPARFQVNSKLSSTYEVTDSAGKFLRSIVVPGIILSVQRPVVLTANTATAPTHGIF